jgi:plastocyanin
MPAHSASALIIWNAPAAATLNLAVQLLLGLALLAGMMLARRQRFRAHGLCQSLVMLLNLIPIGLYMLPVFRRSVLPKFPGSAWRSTFYALPAAHAVIGTVAELLGLYIILRAGTDLLPKALRFANYRLWMRTALALWWAAIAFGLATFAVWHLADDSAPAAVPVQAGNAPGAAALSATVTITMKNFAFEPNEITVAPGTTVVWKGVQGKHTIRADDGGFESDVVLASGEFSYRFEKEGHYRYYCALHGEPGGKEMSGTVIVTRARP